MQTTSNKILQSQINAGLSGRKRGHSYESIITHQLNEIKMPYIYEGMVNTNKHIYKGQPATILLEKIMLVEQWNQCVKIEAYSTGALATAEDGLKEIIVEGKAIRSSKSDIIIVMYNEKSEKRIVGVSVKQCNNAAPTNAQVFFTTATAFYNLMIDNKYQLSGSALTAMRQFCGDQEFRPIDNVDCKHRIPSNERYFWEEIESAGRREWETLFKEKQDEITKLLLQKGYMDDPFPPSYIIHKTKRAIDVDEVAVYSMGEFIELSHKYASFGCSTYHVKKGRHKEPDNIPPHLAPFFGVIQMQRGGQKQHPTQLQFNLKAGYFYKLEEL